jgi:hypothetical protein
MKKIFTTLLILGTGFYSFSQKLDTVYRNAGYGQMEHVGLFKEGNGNTVIAGTYAQSINDIDPGAGTVTLPSASNFGFYIIKYSASGAYQSHLGVYGTGNVMAQDATRDASGNYYVVGEFSGTADFDPSGAVFNVSSGTSNSKAFIAKYDQNLNFLSVNTFTNTNYSSFQSVKTDAAGKVYVGGYFWGTQDFDFGTGTVSETSATTGSNLFAVYDPNFNLLNRFANFGRFKTLCEVDNSGNIYLAGSFDAMSDFDPSAATYTLSPNGGSDVYIAKYNASMALQWAGQIGGANSESLKNLKLDAFENPLLLGEFSGTVDFNISTSAAYTLTSVATDNFLVRMSSIGTFNWARQYQLSNLTANVLGDYVNVDAANNVYFTGSFNGTKNFNNGGTPFNMVATGDVDGFVEKLDNTGNQVWCFRFGGSTPGYNYTGGHCISLESSGQFNLIGSMRAVNDFDPSPYDSVSVNAYTGFYNSYIARYNQLKTLAISNTSLCAGATLNVPYKIEGTAAAGNVFTAQLSNAAGNFSAPINIGTLSSTGSGTISATIPSTVLAGSNYRVRVVGSDPLQAGERNNANIVINNAPLFLTQPVASTVCVNSNASITASVSSNANALQWYFGASAVATATNAVLSLPGVQSSQGGNYYLAASNACGSISSNTITFTVNDPSVAISGNTSVCAGATTTLTAAGTANYSWNTGANTSSIVSTPASTVSYTVTGIDAQGCMDTETVTVMVNTLPNVSALTNNTLLCTGQTVTLTAGGANTYTWSTNEASMSISVNPTITTNYTVTGTDANGCENSAVITQSVSLCTGIAKAVEANGPVMNVYPNPFQDHITILTGTTTGNLKIVDVLGKVVYEAEVKGDDVRINLGHLNSGVYYVVVKDAHKTFNQKIIKQ